MIILKKNPANFRNLALPGMIIVCCCIVCGWWLEQARLDNSRGWSARLYCSGVKGSIPTVGMLCGIFSIGFSGQEDVILSADYHMIECQRVGYSTELAQF